jgi:hypothetical protein
MRDERPVFIVEKNGRPTVVTGWQAVLLTVFSVFIAIAVLALLAIVFLGVAVTLGAVALVVVPAALIAGAVTAFMRRGRP